ncbi:MAG: serpin family protein [Actinobacteria bacterium]|nr:serpin family protein [Actinomycetota bacterium]
MDELRRRTFLALLGATVMAALLESCGGNDDPAPATTASASGDVQRIAAPADDAPAAATAVDDFGVALYRQLAAADASGNIVMSPASIAIALTMTMAGARGNTLDEMVATLRIDDPSTIHRSMNALTAALDALSRDEVTLELANSLWGQAGLAFETPFLDTLAGEYGAGLELVDYESDPEAARLAINAWVAAATRDRIRDLLSEDVITEDTRLTLVNAIYLKAAWATQFDTTSTADSAFTTASGDEVEVPMMSRTMQMDHASGDGWQAVELPYANGSLAMLIIVPESGFLALFEETFLLSDSVPYLAPRQVQLRLPRFDIESKLPLADQLVEMGMGDAFSFENADFSGITDAADLAISAVVHQANITVTEAGTEAAAATAVVMQPTSAAPEDELIELVVDRPFVFAVRDRKTGAVLFLGRVADPRS